MLPLPMSQSAQIGFDSEKSLDYSDKTLKHVDVMRNAFLAQDEEEFRQSADVVFDRFIMTLSKNQRLYIGVLLKDNTYDYFQGNELANGMRDKISKFFDFDQALLKAEEEGKGYVLQDIRHILNFNSKESDKNYVQDMQSFLMASQRLMDSCIPTRFPIVKEIIQKKYSEMGLMYERGICYGLDESDNLYCQMSVFLESKGKREIKIKKATYADTAMLSSMLRDGYQIHTEALGNIKGEKAKDLLDAKYISSTFIVEIQDPESSKWGVYGTLSTALTNGHFSGADFLLGAKDQITDGINPVLEFGSLALFDQAYGQILKEGDKVRVGIPNQIFGGERVEEILYGILSLSRFMLHNNHIDPNKMNAFAVMQYLTGLKMIDLGMPLEILLEPDKSKLAIRFDEQGNPDELTLEILKGWNYWFGRYSGIEGSDDRLEALRSGYQEKVVALLHIGNQLLNKRITSFQERYNKQAQTLLIEQEA